MQKIKLTTFNSISNRCLISSLQIILLCKARSTWSACVRKSLAAFNNIASKVPLNAIDC